MRSIADGGDAVGDAGHRECAELDDAGVGTRGLDDLDHEVAQGAGGAVCGILIPRRDGPGGEVVPQEIRCGDGEGDP